MSTTETPETEPIQQPEPQQPVKSVLATMPTSGFGISPTNFEEAWKLAQMLATSNFVPEAYKDKPKDCLFAMAYGAEIGLSMLQAVQGIALINGRPAVWGDALLGIVRANHSIVSIEEFIAGEGDAQTATCIVTRLRNGREEHTTGTFSVAQAKAAKLWQKKGKNGGDTPWVTYPERMLKMRARGFALRDGAADLLKGIISAEEAYDMPVEKNITPVPVAPLFDGSDDRDALIDELVAKVKWTRARLEVEWKACNGDKDELIRRLERDSKNIRDREGRATHQGARNEVVNSHEGVTPIGLTDAPLAKMTAPTRNRLFAVLTELGLAEKSKRIAWAEEKGVIVDSFSKLTEVQAQFLADTAQGELDFQKGTPAGEPKEIYINTSPEPCPACLAKTDDEHTSGCPEVIA